MADDLDIDFDLEPEAPLLVCFVDEDGDLQVQINTDQLGDAQNAGLILAALEHHFAGALNHIGAEASEDAALKAVHTAYETELREMTNENTGGML